MGDKEKFNKCRKRIINSWMGLKKDQLFRYDERILKLLYDKLLNIDKENLIKIYRLVTGSTKTQWSIIDIIVSSILLEKYNTLTSEEFGAI